MYCFLAFSTIVFLAFQMHKSTCKTFVTKFSFPLHKKVKQNQLDGSQY